MHLHDAICSMSDVISRGDPISAATSPSWTPEPRGRVPESPWRSHLPPPPVGRTIATLGPLAKLEGGARDVTPALMLEAVGTLAPLVPEEVATESEAEDDDLFE